MQEDSEAPVELPGVDPARIEGLMSDALGLPQSLLAATALGESTRETPWLIDVKSAGGSAFYVLRYGDSVSRNEVAALEAMATHPIPTPEVVCWDEGGAATGLPVFVSEFIQGEPLLPPMVAGEVWAIDLYLDTACTLQAVQEHELPTGVELEGGETIGDVIERAYQRFTQPSAMQQAAYRRLLSTRPDVPEPEFSNGDLWPENILVRDRRLVGVIDWQHAGWTDPLFEFLLPFFLVPELRNKGVEERYCERKGFDSAMLHWYHGVEFFDSLSIVLKLGEPYEIHTADTLTRALELWLSE